MTSKRTSESISPISRINVKQRRTMDSPANELAEIEGISEQIAEIEGKQNPDMRDMIRMISLVSKRDELRIKAITIPQVVNRAVETRINEAMAEGGPIMKAIDHRIEEATDDLREKVKELEEKLRTKGADSPPPTLSRNLKKIIQAERARGIEESGKGIVVFGRAVMEGESAKTNDDKLRDFVRSVCMEEEAVLWKRMAWNAKALREWKGDKPPGIMVRLTSWAARERIMRETRGADAFVVRREIPDILREEFKILQREAKEIREKDNCQTYVGLAGSDIFIRRRRDEGDRWKTVRRL